MSDGSSNHSISVPYFDSLPQKFSEGDVDALLAFGRHLHWGYWSDPTKADGSVADFAIAAENLSRLVTDVAEIQDGLSILDVGCGFGGTIASLNERFCSMHLVGININTEQLLRAETTVQALPNNHIKFVDADACQLPFSDDYFDVVLAVESIFAFSSREYFFREARRILRPGGRLTICDFIPIQAFYRTWKLIEKATKTLVVRTYGSRSVNFCPLFEYKKLASATGFELVKTENITRNTLPTYPVVNSLMRREGDEETYRATRGLERLSRRGLLQYMILSFQISPS
ncbi:methyltransferase domain-containing protein [Komarekiella sp. 'clone 1']|uniref:Methyltransferase domain-containing protein n=1 Tax=Komarekiella delphini-convector SJRDD-AB1 TaxID=2593771 RepID=A0AA41BA65_9NOST|nr:class I SAM-dependent methyltransferase [Komarekiella delphini-convector]MBD6621025.1 methyltransferase domain-containing protein [Komarekiella delphini-convector SJRDD-AB1]